jgi:8-oxo-dGTP diphosphatase
MSTDREDITRTVARIEPADEQEASHRRTVLDWIGSGAELYRRQQPDQPPVHLVSYFVPFDAAAGSVLLAAHRKSGLTLPPGGHCEPGELPWRTAERECREELGVHAVAPAWLGPEPLFVTVTQTQGTTVPRHTDVSLWYVIDVAREQPLAPDPGEFGSVTWMPFEQLLAAPLSGLDPHLHRFTRKLRWASRAAG